jgi:hypothetical protein
MTNIETIKAAVALLRQIIPSGPAELYVAAEGAIRVSHYRPPTYKAGVEWMRSQGLGVRQKRVWDNYTSLKGESDGIEFWAFPDGLPPTCRKETYIERVPKQQTVDTGDVIEVSRMRIICGGEPKEVGTEIPVDVDAQAE